MKNWLVKKFGGYTKEQYDNAIRQNFIQELETRVRNGKDIVIGVRNMGMFDSLEHLFNKDICQINRATAIIKYHDFTFRVVNVTNIREIHKLRGINLNGFFFID